MKSGIRKGHGFLSVSMAFMQRKKHKSGYFLFFSTKRFMQVNVSSLM